MFKTKGLHKQIAFHDSLVLFHDLPDNVAMVKCTENKIAALKNIYLIVLCIYLLCAVQIIISVEFEQFITINYPFLYFWAKSVKCLVSNLINKGT